MATFPTDPTLEGLDLTSNILVNNPPLIQQLMVAILAKKLIGGTILKGRVNATGSGAAIFTTDEDIYATEDDELIPDLGEYPNSDEDDPDAEIVEVGKYGLGTIIPDKLISRRRDDVVQRKITKLANRLAKSFDTRVLSAVGSAISLSYAAPVAWDDATANQFRDVLRGRAVVNDLDLGFNVDTVLLDSDHWALLASSDVVLNSSPRESANTPVYTGNLIQVGGLTLLEATNLPTSVEVAVLDSTNLGSIVWEDQGGGWQGDPSDVLGAQTKLVRLDKQDGWLLQARKIMEPGGIEPNAIAKITGA